MRLAISKALLGSAILIALLASEAHAQGLFGRAMQGFGQGMQQSRSSQSYHGNPWARQGYQQFRSSNQQAFSYQNQSDYVRPRSGTQSTPNVGGILSDAFNAAGVLTSGRRYDPNSGYRGSDGRYYPPQLYYPRTQTQQNFVQRQPVTTVTPPVRNVIPQEVPQSLVIEEDLPEPNEDIEDELEEFERRGNIGIAMTNECVNSVEQSCDLIDQEIEQKCLGTADATVHEACNNAVISQSSEAWELFRREHGDKLPPDAQQQLEARIVFAELEQGLRGGRLTPAGVSQKTAALRDMIALWPDSPTKAKVSASLVQVIQLNELLSLAPLAQETDNPWIVMFEGLLYAGYPASYFADVCGVPVRIDPVTDSGGNAAATTVILNPEETGQSVHYNLGPYPFSIGPGQAQRLERSYVISFDPGNGGTVKKYTLGTGTYQFVVGPGGWDLQSVKVAVTIDNSQYKGTFHYQVDGKDAVLQSGQAVDLTSLLPIVIAFDRGDGGKPARKILTHGTYRVGIDAVQRRLDLFDANHQPDIGLLAASEPESSIISISTSKSKSKRDRRDRQIQDVFARLKTVSN